VGLEDGDAVRREDGDAVGTKVGKKNEGAGPFRSTAGCCAGDEDGKYALQRSISINSFRSLISYVSPFPPFLLFPPFPCLPFFPLFAFAAVASFNASWHMQYVGAYAGEL